MLYNQEDEENFLSDRKVGEVNAQEPPRRRGGYVEPKESDVKNIVPSHKKKVMPVEDDTQKKESNIIENVVLVVAVIVIIVAAVVLIKVFVSSPKDNKEANNSNKTNQTTNSSSNKGQNSSNSSNKNNTSTNNSSSYAISSVNDMYDAYAIKIESVVSTKGGNFFNNTEKIKGDKAYVEYKQISGLKDKEKEEEINKKLKELSTSLYDKNYLSDKDTLFIDVHTKLSVNFNTLSYVVIKTYEDIDGNHKDEKVISYNIRLDTLEEIEFEDLFVDGFNISQIYSKYTKGKVNAFYFDPKTIYIYEKDLTETEIDISKNYSNIAIYKRFKDVANIFTSSRTEKKVFTVLNSTVSEETKDRDFTKN